MLPPLADQGSAPSSVPIDLWPSNAIVSKKFRSGGTICAVNGFDTDQGGTDAAEGRKFGVEQ
jgi:hypothetical protein